MPHFGVDRLSFSTKRALLLIISICRKIVKRKLYISFVGRSNIRSLRIQNHRYTCILVDIIASFFEPLDAFRAFCFVERGVWLIRQNRIVSFIYYGLVKFEEVPTYAFWKF